MFPSLIAKEHHCGGQRSPAVLCVTVAKTLVRECSVTQSCWSLCDPMDCSPPGSPIHGDSPGKNTGVSFSRRSSRPRDRTQVSPASQVDSLLSEPPGKPKNTAVGSLSLLQGIFPTQDSNQGLLHCRRILYQLSNQGSPTINQVVSNMQRFRKLTW